MKILTFALAIGLALLAQPVAAQDEDDDDDPGSGAWFIWMLILGDDGELDLVSQPAPSKEEFVGRLHQPSAGHLPEPGEAVFVVIHGSRDRDPSSYVAKEGTGTAIGDFDGDGFDDLGLVHEIAALKDVDGDGTLDLLTAPGKGGGPHVLVFNAYPGFTGGVRVAVGDVNGDRTDDIVIESTGRRSGEH